MHKRIEVLCTSSLKQQISARSILEEKGIDCRLVVTSSAGKAVPDDRHAAPDSAANEYRIFVYHKDYERASALLRARMA